MRQAGQYSWVVPRPSQLQDSLHLWVIAMVSGGSSRGVGTRSSFACSLAQLVLDCKTRAGLAGRFQQWQRQSTPSAWTSRPSRAPADGLLLFLFLQGFDSSTRRSLPTSSSRRCRHTHGHAVR